MVKVNILVLFRGKELVKKKLALIRKEEKETAAKQLKESQVKQPKVVILVWAKMSEMTGLVGLWVI